MSQPYNYRLKSSARHLRRAATDAERRLWTSLRRRQLGGYRFFRQRPIGRYIVDFYCPVARLVVEVDGGQHFDRENRARDERRTRELEARGLRVLRFDNRQVLRHTTDVLEEILRWVGADG